MSSNFGELVLVLGDLHIPERASKIAAPFKRMLVPNRMQHVICTGNVGSSAELWDEIQQLAPAIHCVAGDFDDDYNVFPETCVVQVGQFRIGVIHGHQLLPWGSKESVERMRRKLRVDILVTGNTHQSAVFDESDGFYHINPVRCSACSIVSPVSAYRLGSSAGLHMGASHNYVFSYSLVIHHLAIIIRDR
jgi:vacuolar protein sorting-associated protein 29